MEKEELKTLCPEQLYMLATLEAKVAEYENVNLANTQREFQGVEQRRQELITILNQIQGAIIGGKIMIQQELEKAGIDAATYEAIKANQRQPETAGNLIEFPNRGNEDETSETANDDAPRGSAG